MVIGELKKSEPGLLYFLFQFALGNVLVCPHDNEWFPGVTPGNYFAPITNPYPVPVFMPEAHLMRIIFEFSLEMLFQ